MAEFELNEKNTIRAVTGCLIWLGRRSRDGYGKVSVNGKEWYVHRLVWEIANGRPKADGMHIDHTCGQSMCVEADHLEEVTPRENIIRSWDRRSYGVTECKNGHAYTPENTYVSPKRGTKSCKECARQRSRAFKAKNPDYMKQYRASR